MNNPYSAEATLFFDDHQIIKQMTYSEFQAVLDAYVPLQDLASKRMKAVYLRINTQLHVTASVFFYIRFDAQGYADKSWDVPLEQLADSTAKGPNLGSGPIKLACYSRCPIAWHQKNLWDPGMDANSNDFVQLKKAIRKNALGFIFSAKDERREAGVDNGRSITSGNKPQFDEERTRAALMIKEQRLKYNLMMSHADQEKRQLRLDHQEKLLSYQVKLSELEQMLVDSTHAFNSLDTERAQLEEKNTGLREYYENKFKLSQESEQQDLGALNEYYESELLLRVEAAVSESNSQLQTKDVEILYRKEREQQLQQEVLSLQKDNELLFNQTADNDILSKLADSGISFVVYHPGAGHISIPQVSIADYLSNTSSYVAEQCGVNEQLYRLWLNHFYTPLCQHSLEHGSACSVEVNRVEDPSQFVIGSSDRCVQHRSKMPTVVNISKNGRQA